MSNKKEVLKIKKGSLNIRDSLIGFLFMVFFGSFAAFSNLQSKINDFENRLVEIEQVDKLDLNKYQPPLAVNDAQFILDKIISLENDIIFLEKSINEESKIPDTTKDDISNVNNVSSSENYKYKSNWRKLSIGMSRERVRAILGEPDKINVSYFEDWFYPKGEVSFSKLGLGLNSWSEPNWN